MTLRIYTKNGQGFTAEEVRRGDIYLYCDVTCPHCGKEQPALAGGHLGGPCVKCGKATNA